VTSQPGMGGGWRLRRDPAEITLLQVYRAVDEGRHLVALPQRAPNPQCLVGRNIQRSLEFYFGEAENAFELVLAGQTIAQVLATVSEDPQCEVG
jgi:DNA-binding IscR family transcriptional regulator